MEGHHKIWLDLRYPVTESIIFIKYRSSRKVNNGASSFRTKPLYKLEAQRTATGEPRPEMSQKVVAIRSNLHSLNHDWIFALLLSNFVFIHLFWLILFIFIFTTWFLMMEVHYLKFVFRYLSPSFGETTSEESFNLKLFCFFSILIE